MQINFAVNAKLICAFVYATQIVQSFCFLNPNFQVSSLFLRLYRSVCVRPVWKPQCWFSREAAHMFQIQDRGLTVNFEMWNQRVLIPPPTCSFKATLTQELRGKLQYVQGQLVNGKSDLASHLEVLVSEQYVQDRMVYKLSSQFRSEKSLKHLKQSRVCLTRLKELDLQKQLDDLIDTFNVNIHEEETIYLPSKQTFQYYLVRMMSTAALMARTCQLLKETNFHAKQLMEIGNMLSQNLMLIAISARLWVVCKSLKSCVCVWYKALYPLLEHLQETPVVWLQSDETLPTSLTSWLQFDADSSQDDDSMLAEAADLSFNGSDSDEKMAWSRIDKPSLSLVTEDIGEPIQRKTREGVGSKMATIDQHSIAADNKLSVDQNRKSEHDGNDLFKASEDGKPQLNKAKVKKHLEKKLKTLVRMVKTLKKIKQNNTVQIGLYEFETTAEFRQTAKQMLGTCRQLMKENPKGSQISKKNMKSENSKIAQFQKNLIYDLLELSWQNKPKISMSKSVDDLLNNVASMKETNEGFDIIDICNENDGKPSSDTDKFYEVIEIRKSSCSEEDIEEVGSTMKKQRVKDESLVIDIDEDVIEKDIVNASLKVKRKRNKSNDNRKRKKEGKVIEENIDVEKVSLSDMIEEHKVLNRKPDIVKTAKSGKKITKNKSLSNYEKPSGHCDVLEQKRNKTAETVVQKKTKLLKGDKVVGKRKKKRGNKEFQMQLP